MINFNEIEVELPEWVVDTYVSRVVGPNGEMPECNYYDADGGHWTKLKIEIPVCEICGRHVFRGYKRQDGIVVHDYHQKLDLGFYKSQHDYH